MTIDKSIIEMLNTDGQITIPVEVTPAVIRAYRNFIYYYKQKGVLNQHYRVQPRADGLLITCKRDEIDVPDELRKLLDLSSKFFEEGKTLRYMNQAILKGIRKLRARLLRKDH